VIDPEFSTAKEYAAKLNEKLANATYVPGSEKSGAGASWRPQQSSNQGNQEVDVPEKVEILPPAERNSNRS